MKAFRIARALFVLGACTALSQAVVAGQDEQARSFNRVQYLGGMVGFRGTSPRWDNTLTISPTRIAMRNRGAVLLFEIDPSQVASLQYLKYGTNNNALFLLAVYAPIPALAIGALVPGAARRGDHFIAIDYFFGDCQRGALLLRAHKENYKDVIAAVTGISKASEVSRAADAWRACFPQRDDSQTVPPKPKFLIILEA